MTPWRWMMRVMINSASECPCTCRVCWKIWKWRPFSFSGGGIMMKYEFTEWRRSIMIRELTEADRQQVLDFLMPESSFNLFLIGDIHNHGFCREFQQLWGDFDEQGRLRAVLLRW